MSFIESRYTFGTLEVKGVFHICFQIPSIAFRKRSNVPNRLPLLQLRSRRPTRESGDFNSERSLRTRSTPNRNIPLKRQSPAEGVKRRRARILGAQFYLRHRRPAIFLGDARLISNVQR